MGEPQEAQQARVEQEKNIEFIDVPEPQEAQQGGDLKMLAPFGGGSVTTKQNAGADEAGAPAGITKVEEADPAYLTFAERRTLFEGQNAGADEVPQVQVDDLQDSDDSEEEIGISTENPESNVAQVARAKNEGEDISEIQLA